MKIVLKNGDYLLIEHQDDSNNFMLVEVENSSLQVRTDTGRYKTKEKLEGVENQNENTLF